MSKQDSPVSPQRGSKGGSKKGRRRLRPWRLLLLVLIFTFLLTGGAGVGVMAGILKDLPSVDDLSYMQTAESSFIYDRHGNLITELHGAEDREFIKFEDIPPHVKNAFLAIEDHRFYHHFGIDIGGIFRALWNNLRGGHTQGASTITQQLARTIFPIGREVTLRRKIQEAILAIQLERRYIKDEIFEMYLNQIFLGHNAYGIKAAARRFFDKDVADLTLSEAAILASIPKAPSYYSPYTNLEPLLTRRNLVLSRMAELGMVSEAEAAAAREEVPAIAELEAYGSYPYPSFVNHVIDELLGHFTRFYLQEGEDEAQAGQRAAQMVYAGGLRIETTLDPAIQETAQEAVVSTLDSAFPVPQLSPEESADPAKAKNVTDPVQAAVVVLDTKDGAIRAIVGGPRSEEGVQRGFNLATQGTRQPGSAFKPLIAYGAALEYGWTAGTVLNDAPTDFAIPGQPPYRPRNYGTAPGSSGSYRGLITLRDAVRESKNVPAVQTLYEIGVDRGVEFAQRLGISTLVTEPRDGRHDRVLSAALGGLTDGVTVLDMAKAYAVFGNQGIRSEPYAITKVSDRHGRVWLEQRPKQEQVISPEVAYIMTDVLRNVIYPHRLGVGGTAGRWGLPGGRPAAGKTGTTNNWTDAWFVGYTPQLTTAVWIGHAKEQRTLRDSRGSLVTGGSHPAAIWHAIMAKAHESMPVEDFPRPQNIVNAVICSKTGTLPGPYCPEGYRYTEVFIQGTEPTQVEDIFQPYLVCADRPDVLYTPGCTCDPVEKIFMRPAPQEEGEEGATDPLPREPGLLPPTTTCTPFGRPVGPPVGSATITVEADSFRPGRITGFRAGSHYRLTITSTERDFRFVIPEVNLQATILAGETATVHFIPPRAGNYLFYFRADGEELGPGTLVVTGSSPFDEEPDDGDEDDEAGEEAGDDNGDEDAGRDDDRTRGNGDDDDREDDVDDDDDRRNGRGNGPPFSRRRGR